MVFLHGATGSGRAHMRAVLGDQRRKPVDIGEADPARLPLGSRQAGLVDVLVVPAEVHLVVEQAYRARVQVPGVLAGGAAGAVEERVRLHRHRLRARVGHGLLGGDHVVLVDGVADGEALTGAVVPRQRDWAAGRQGPAAGLPLGLGIGQLDGGGALGHYPAELREFLRRGAGWRKQADGARVLLDSLAVGLKHEVVEPGADGIDRAGDLGRIDRHPARRSQRRGKVGHFLALLTRIDQPAVAAVRRGRARRGGDGLRLVRLLGRLRSRVDLAEEQVETQQQRQAQRDGNDKVTLVVQIAILSEIAARRAQGRALKAPGRSHVPPTGGSALAALPPSIHP